MKVKVLLEGDKDSSEAKIVTLEASPDLLENLMKSKDIFKNIILNVEEESKEEVWLDLRALANAVAY